MKTKHITEAVMHAVFFICGMLAIAFVALISLYIITAGLPAIGDDSGLCVDWLQGAPGIYSARYGNLDSDPARCALLLQNMRGATNRAAHFHTSICCAFPNGDVLTADGDCHGTIAFAPMGERGFGYDPVFFVPEKRRTFAQLTAEEKNEISHRGNALRVFAAELKEYLEKH